MDASSGMRPLGSHAPRGGLSEQFFEIEIERIWTMPQDTLKGLKVAILVTDGFEQVELTRPRKALDESGAQTRIVSPKDSSVRSWNFKDWDREGPLT
jgi:hypothetical protein